MTDTAGKQRPAVRLADYRVPSHHIDAVSLDIAVHDGYCQVSCSYSFNKNPAAGADNSLWLDGRQLELCGLSVDGKPVAAQQLQIHAEGLRLLDLPPSGRIEVVTRLHPDSNASMEGLYRSGAILCTQCEAHGFSRITYFPDRPDILARYSVRIEADSATYPQLLANGNCRGRGQLPDGRHWVRWEDPFPKPSYLFAVVAGNLDVISARHDRPDGSQVDVQLYVDPGYSGRARFALQALLRAMRWDEQTYGLACDLDEYKVVAVRDFNMGAMENKGLNLFNSRYVLADDATATDDDYAAIEAVIGHEYFHNWTGNRVTCRDWFQLSLKEGLTVFREQQFCAAQGSPGVSRIDCVRTLRAQQFPEDAGPLAHPVQPPSYVEINNFYTATVYEKGAEVVGMLLSLLGAACFTRGVQRYLRDNDGRAATIDDWLAAHARESGRDLTQFQRWYHQVGTPTVLARGEYDALERCFHLSLQQQQPRLHGQEQPPLHIPLRLALFGEDGLCLHQAVVEMTAAEQTFVIPAIAAAPVLSLNRGFSAPVHCRVPQSRETLQQLALVESDAYARWQALQELFSRALLGEYHLSTATGADTRSALAACTALLQALPADHALAAELLRLPSLQSLAAGLEAMDPLRLVGAHRLLQLALARDAVLLPRWQALAQLPRPPYRYATEAAGARRLAALALEYFVASGSEQARDIALDQYQRADNLTDRQAALNALSQSDSAQLQTVLQASFVHAGDDALLLDKWFALQAQLPFAGAAERVARLLQHPCFDWRNPNRLRSVLGSFATRNLAGFHAEQGAVYAAYVQWLLRTESLNPQLAARLAQPLAQWHQFAEPWRGNMRAALQDLATAAHSADVGEICSRALQPRND